MHELGAEFVMGFEQFVATIQQMQLDPLQRPMLGKHLFNCEIRVVPAP